MNSRFLACSDLSGVRRGYSRAYGHGIRTLSAGASHLLTVLIPHSLSEAVPKCGSELCHIMFADPKPSERANLAPQHAGVRQHLTAPKGKGQNRLSSNR